MKILLIKKLNEDYKNSKSIIDHYENERKDLLSKYNSFNEELRNSQKIKREEYEKKYKEKIILKKLKKILIN